ncbi:metallophosphoesterase family protein [Phenylobacterium terrae]|uniref:Metallophosphoesterase family protein n=1 Tax=Phenylobacterium terrae TaxID=2665495 RepID=A0ABW4MWW8_9CAUL
MVRTDRIEGARFGLVADTHDSFIDWPAALAAIGRALGPVDGIIHCGDISTRKAVADLSRLAPVWAVRSSGDEAADPPALVDGPRVLEAGGVRIGVVFSLSDPPVGAKVDPELAFGEVGPEEACRRLFGGRVDVCAFGGSHVAAVLQEAGTLFVNPGSPTLADKRSVAVLSLAGGAPAVEVVPVG